MNRDVARTLNVLVITLRALFATLFRLIEIVAGILARVLAR
jgi:hypothetical protein